MAKDKNKNQAYGTFAAGKKGFLVQIRQRTALIILAVVFVGGSGVAIYKGLGSLMHKEEAVLSEETSPEIPAWWQQQYFGTSVCEKEICRPESDPDNDKLTNAQEFYYHTHPQNAHTAKDELNDGELVAKGFDPSKEGRMTFEIAASSDAILGESLVFDQDLKTMINETADIRNIQLPVVKKNEIKTTADSTQSVTEYLQQVEEVIGRHLPGDYQSYVEQAIISRDADRIADLQQRFFATELELRQMTVPVTFYQMHKYSIMFLRALSKVVDVPPTMSLENEADAIGNIWYENTQALALLHQKMEAEVNRLKKLK